MKYSIGDLYPVTSYWIPGSAGFSIFTNIGHCPEYLIIKIKDNIIICLSPKGELVSVV